MSLRLRKTILVPSNYISHTFNSCGEVTMSYLDQYTFNSVSNILRQNENCWLIFFRVWGVLCAGNFIASFPGLFRSFCSSVCNQYNTQKWKSTKSGEGLGTPIMCMTSGGHEMDVGEVVPDYKYRCNNLRASFLPVKRSTRDVVNAWGLAWR